LSSRRRHTDSKRDWSSDVCSADLIALVPTTASGTAAARMRAARMPVAPMAVAGTAALAVRGTTLPRAQVSLLTTGCAPQAGRTRSEERRVGRAGRTRTEQQQ